MYVEADPQNWTNLTLANIDCGQFFYKVGQFEFGQFSVINFGLFHCRPRTPENNRETLKKQSRNTENARRPREGAQPRKSGWPEGKGGEGWGGPNGGGVGRREGRAKGGGPKFRFPLPPHFRFFFCSFFERQHGKNSPRRTALMGPVGS